MGNVSQSNPLVSEQGMSLQEAKRLDNFGKGGGSVDEALVREFPLPRKLLSRDAA